MKGRLRDLTSVETTYRKEIRTVRVRVRRTYAGSEDIELATMATPADVHELFRAIYAGLDDHQEHFVMLVLDAAGQVVGYKLIASGAQNRVYMDSKLVFRSALLLGAQAIIVAHNHPTGVLTPSEGDIELTARLALAGKILEVPLLDHVILGKHDDYVSLYEKHPTLFMPTPGEHGEEPGGSGTAG